MSADDTEPTAMRAGPAVMHAGQVQIDAALVRSLVAERFPEWAALPVTSVASIGTVNAVYRLGERMCVRLPLTRDWAGDLDREWQWLPVVAPAVGLEVPAPRARGAATAAYPFPWSIYGWIDGAPYSDEPVRDETDAALALAEFVLALRRVPTDAAPPAGRGPLRELDEVTRVNIAASTGIERDRAQRVWRELVRAPAFDGRPVFIHSDLLRANLLVRDGTLCAVIDWGGCGSGDPAADVIPAWTVFGSAGRRVFREALGVDDGTWMRAAGVALYQAVGLIPYYRESNPGMAAGGRRTVTEVLSEFG